MGHRADHWFNVPFVLAEPLVEKKATSTLYSAFSMPHAPCPMQKKIKTYAATA
ncbi:MULTISPECIES: hypothetical protein [Nostoc]|uniref:Uncharacterized protein n=1 Tax=Nostoc paludosum FACHB-159 TaxID=2692908 RepID=A0ABR8JYK3_9NOSO|nr:MULTISPECIES: hypothetical protein [Nostoc]MBD2676413.1 hypothetical protein [Nostoc sp. FACHB-857]MBD2732456.1 hypothetical protein [Nostoc paludosum FACHB-159]